MTSQEGTDTGLRSHLRAYNAVPGWNWLGRDRNSTSSLVQLFFFNLHVLEELLLEFALLCIFGICHNLSRFLNLNSVLLHGTSGEDTEAAAAISDPHRNAPVAFQSSEV